MGELLKAEQKGDFCSLTFRAEKYDQRLEEMVTFGEGIIVTDECKQFLPNYQKHVGEMVAISVRPIIGKNKRDIYYLTLTDILDPSEILTA
jgi:hypothetical protein